jgi:hypothetical protein
VGNGSEWGAAVGVDGGDLVVEGCLFRVSRSELDVLDTRFIGNLAASGGGVTYPGPGTTGLVRGCWFEDNTAQFDAGAALVGDTEGPVTFERCVFLGNGATGRRSSSRCNSGWTATFR